MTTLRWLRVPEAAVLVLVAAACALSPLLSGPPERAEPGEVLPSPLWLDLDAVLSPPSASHWLGTDLLGRDLLSRLLHGGRATLAIAAGAALLALMVGGVLGLCAGLAGGWVDLWIGRLIEIADCLPTLVLALAAAATGRWRDPLALAVVIGLTRWGDVARLGRTEALRWRATPRRESARASGAGTGRVLVRHLFPAALPLLATAGALVAAEAVIVEAGVGVVGFGIEPPRPTWGNLLLDARLVIDEAWWPAVFPGLAIFLAVASFLGLAERAGLSPAQRFGRRRPGAAVPGSR